MKRKMIMMLLSVTVGLALIAGATWAWFTDEDDAGDATFTAGILRIDVSDGLDLLYELESRIGNMNPGDLYEPIELIITNTGTKKLIWFGNWEITGGQNCVKLSILTSLRWSSLVPIIYPIGNLQITL